LWYKPTFTNFYVSLRFTESVPKICKQAGINQYHSWLLRIIRHQDTWMPSSGHQMRSIHRTPRLPIRRRARVHMNFWMRLTPSLMVSTNHWPQSLQEVRFFRFLQFRYVPRHPLHRHLQWQMCSYIVYVIALMFYVYTSANHHTHQIYSRELPLNTTSLNFSTEVLQNILELRICTSRCSRVSNSRCLPRIEKRRSNVLYLVEFYFKRTQVSNTNLRPKVTQNDAPTPCI
jgi:hypothetical protein